MNTNNRQFVATVMSVLLAAEAKSAASTAVPNQLEHLVVVEAEQCTDDAGAPIAIPKRDKEARSTNVCFNADAQASGGGWITPVPPPYRIHKPFPKPIEAVTEVAIPTAGRWYGHVRYRVTPDSLGNMEYRKATETVKHFHAFAPFQVAISGKSFTVGTNQTVGAEFRWDKFAVDLPAGRTTIKFLMPDMAGPDCLVLTPIMDYSPDVTDYEGPLWVRFKVVKGVGEPFFILCRCHFNPYEIKPSSKDAGWLFRDMVAASKEEADKLQADPQHLLIGGEWSPWVKTFTAQKKYFYLEALAKTEAGKGMRGFDHVEMAYQAATRPDEAFLVHEGVESSGGQRGVFILMPTETGVDAMRREVRSFSEWADERLKLVKDLGLQAGEGPRRIEVTTMDTIIRTPREIDVFLETCRLLGFNSCDAEN